MKKIKILFILLIILLISSCSSTPKFQNIYDKEFIFKKGKYGGQINISYFNELKNINPFLAINSTELEISNLLFDSILTYNPFNKKMDYNFCKELQFNSSEDVLRVVIKEDLFDSDKESIDAEYLATYYNLLKKLFEHDDRYNFLTNYNYSNINNTLLIIKKNLSKNDFFKILGIPILSVNLTNKIIKDNDLYYSLLTSESLIKFKSSTGPWVIENFKNKNLTLIRNKFYYKTDKKGNQLPYLDKLNFIYYKDPFKEIKDFSINKIHIMKSYIKDLPYFKDLKSARTIVLPNFEENYTLFFSNNLTNKHTELKNNLSDFKNLFLDHEIINKISNLLPNSYPLNTCSEVTFSINENSTKINLFTKKPISIHYLKGDKTYLQIIEILKELETKYNLNLKFIPEDVNSFIAKIYASNDWDIILLNKHNNIWNFPPKDLFYPNIHRFYIQDKDSNIIQLIDKIYNIHNIENIGENIDSFYKEVTNNNLYINLLTLPNYITINKEIKNIFPFYNENRIDKSYFKYIYTFIK